MAYYFGFGIKSGAHSVFLLSSAVVERTRENAIYVKVLFQYHMALDDKQTP